MQIDNNGTINMDSMVLIGTCKHRQLLCMSTMCPLDYTWYALALVPNIITLRLNVNHIQIHFLGVQHFPRWHLCTFCPLAGATQVSGTMLCIFFSPFFPFSFPFLLYFFFLLFSFSFHGGNFLHFWVLAGETKRSESFYFGNIAILFPPINRHGNIYK